MARGGVRGVDAGVAVGREAAARDGRPYAARVREDLIERVLLTVAQVPPGQVASYGDIGAAAGVGPRYVGHVLRLHGAGVPWWRVTSASGELPAELLCLARRHWRAEGVPEASHGRGCRLRDVRVDPHQLAADLAEALGL